MDCIGENIGRLVNCKEKVMKKAASEQKIPISLTEVAVVVTFESIVVRFRVLYQQVAYSCILATFSGVAAKFVVFKK